MATGSLPSVQGHRSCLGVGLGEAFHASDAGPAEGK